MVGTWNWLFYIHPDSLVETNPLVRAAFAMRPVWKPGTWVYLGSFNADTGTMSCLNPQVNFKDMDRTKLTETGQELQEFARTGHETWIDQSGVDLLKSNEGSRQWLVEHTRPGFKRDFSVNKQRLSFDRLFYRPLH